LISLSLPAVRSQGSGAPRKRQPEPQAPARPLPTADCPGVRPAGS